MFHDDIFTKLILNFFCHFNSFIFHLKPNQVAVVSQQSSNSFASAFSEALKLCSNSCPDSQYTRVIG